MRGWPMLAAAMALACATPGLTDAPPVSALARMPVKEITVFKDGHAFVLHEGRMPTDASGAVQMDYLPSPVLGTFWPYSADKDVKLLAVTASPRRVKVTETALTAVEMLRSNPGAEVTITDPSGKKHTGKVVGIPVRSAEELASTSAPNTPERLPTEGSVLLLKGPEGTEVLPLDQVREVVFRSGPGPTTSHEEFRNLLTLRLGWPNGKPEKTASVGMLYLQKGVRWIPGYKVNIDGKGSAVVTLQATLLNEMADLDDVTANLVVGVPTFAFKDTLDPVALQQAVAQLSQYFQMDSRTAYGFSNAIMGQQAARGGEFRAAAPQGEARPMDLGPEVGGSDRAEDLYVYTVRHVSLKRGQRMVLPIVEYRLKYRDIYTLDMPVTPPVEVRSSLNTEQQAELARLFNAPKVMHKLRIANDSKQPLTTAPALIVMGDRPLGQGMMTYASAGGTVDLPITTAIDVKCKRAEKEAGRTPNAVTYQDRSYGRIDMTGTITLTNYRAEPVTVEVTRYVLGHADKVDHGGTAIMPNAWTDDEAVTPDRPYWWGWYNWPFWWGALNGMGRFSWTVRVEPGKPLDLGYTWHYFWQ